MPVSAPQAPTRPAASIFVSYRRNDAQRPAGRLYESLVREFSAASVFRDLDSTVPGADFAARIDECLQDCVALIAVIGPKWLSARRHRWFGPRRLHEPDDWVRREIATALERDIAVIPVLVDGARLPAADELPADLKALARHHAMALHDDGWSAGMDRLIGALPRLGTGAAARARRAGTGAAGDRERAFAPPFRDALTPLGRDRECQAER